MCPKLLEFYKFLFDHWVSAAARVEDVPDIWYITGRWKMSLRKMKSWRKLGRCGLLEEDALVGQSVQVHTHEQGAAFAFSLKDWI